MWSVTFKDTRLWSVLLSVVCPETVLLLLMLALKEALKEWHVSLGFSQFYFAHPLVYTRTVRTILLLATCEYCTEEGGDSAMFQATTARHCGMYELPQHTSDPHGSQSVVAPYESLSYWVGYVRCRIQVWRTRVPVCLRQQDRLWGTG